MLLLLNTESDDAESMWFCEERMCSLNLANIAQNRSNKLEQLSVNTMKPNSAEKHH